MKKAVIIFALILGETAEKIFNRNKGIDKVYMTSDGQGFTKKHKAESHAKYLKDKKIEEFERKVISKPPEGDLIDVPESPLDLDELKREDLMEEYEHRFGSKPPANIKTETMVAKLSVAEAEKEEK